MKTAEQQLARGLGVFSTALGAASLAAPRRVSRAIGLRDTAGTRAAVRAVGVQELTAAGGIFQMGLPAPQLWARVSGDVLHVGLLGRAMLRREANPVRTAVAIGAVVGVGVLDLVAARRIGSAGRPTTAAITVRAAKDDVERRWHELGHPGGPATFRDAPGDQGTEVVVELAGEAPEHDVRDDLRRFKQLVETGEVVRSDGSPDGIRTRNQWHQHEARPHLEVVA